MDEDLAFEWLDRYFDNMLGYKEFRKAIEKATVVCNLCHYQYVEDSDDEEHAQEELLRTYWRKFDAERIGWVYADLVIDYLANDWGITVDPEQRTIERKLLHADEDGKIRYRDFKQYFTAVPEDDLKQRVSSVGCVSNVSMKQFEK